MSLGSNTYSYRVGNGLNVAVMTLSAGEAPAVPPRVNHIMDIDVSGSMSGDLGQLGTHLKNNLALVVKPGDTVTTKYFSGRGQHGVIFEGVEINSLADMREVHRAIDQWLRPIGLTGFKEPLQETERVIERLSKARPDSVFSYTFMSDGCDNQWKRSEIIEVCDRLGAKLASTAVVEYGWYADRPLLVAMAESMGGEYVFAQGFSTFAPIMDAQFGKNVSGAPRREVVLPAMPRHGVAFAVIEGKVVVYGATPDLKLRVPADVSTLYFLTEAPLADDRGDVATVVTRARGGAVQPAVDALFASVAVLSQRMLSDDVLTLLRVLGDVRLIKGFANCFGKQAYSAFGEEATAASLRADARWAEGYDPALVPPDDAYTVLDLLNDLLAGEGNKLHTQHEAFDYKRIGRKAVQSSDNLTDEEREEIAGMTANARTSADFERIAARTAEIAAGKAKPVKFVADDGDAGVPIGKLTLSESRPNVSVLVPLAGKAQIGPNDKGVPEQFPTFTFRNYAVIRDGILNVAKLPVSLDKATHARLERQGIVATPWHEGSVVVIDLQGLPLVNRRMVSRISARECFDLAYRMQKAKAAQKVFKEFEKRHAPPQRSEAIAGTWGEDAAAWLAERGITDKGFSPRTTLAAGEDVYTAKEFKVAIKGLATLPTVAKVEEKISARKATTPVESLLVPYIEEAKNFLEDGALAAAPDRETRVRKWLAERVKHWVDEARELNRRLAEIKFSIVLGQVWFPEFDTPGEGSLDFEADGKQLTGTAELKEVEEEV